MKKHAYRLHRHFFLRSKYTHAPNIPGHALLYSASSFKHLHVRDNALLPSVSLSIISEIYLNYAATVHRTNVVSITKLMCACTVGSECSELCDKASISVHATRAMSILNYFRRKDSISKGIFLPVPGNDAVASANTCVGDLASKPPNKRRRTPHSYDAESRAAGMPIIKVRKQLEGILQ